MESLYKSPDQLIHLHETDFEYKILEQTWFDIFGSTDSMRDKPHRCYQITLQNIKLGIISRCENDGTWSAINSTDNDQKMEGRYHVHGFLHELYAVQYLEQVAERLGRLSSLPNRFDVI